MSIPTSNNQAKKRSLGPDRGTTARKEVEELTKAWILREDVHQTWVENPVMVNKSKEGWRMCVDFTDDVSLWSGVGSIRRIQWLGYGVLGVSWSRDHVRYLPESSHSISSIRRIGLLWIQRIDLASFVVFGECRHGYTVSSLMDTAYW
ncbi:hypothetical protein Tco_1130192 [Tanacetum coccineum]